MQTRKFILCGPPVLLFTLPKLYSPEGFTWTVLQNPAWNKKYLDFIVFSIIQSKLDIIRYYL